jgi:hypothetical protein
MGRIVAALAFASFLCLAGSTYFIAPAFGAPGIKTRTCDISVSSDIGSTGKRCPMPHGKCSTPLTVTVTGEPGSDGTAECVGETGLTAIVSCTIATGENSCTVTETSTVAKNTYFYCVVGHALPATDSPTAVCTATVDPTK